MMAMVRCESIEGSCDVAESCCKGGDDLICLRAPSFPWLIVFLRSCLQNWPKNNRSSFVFRQDFQQRTLLLQGNNRLF